MDGDGSASSVFRVPAHTARFLAEQNTAAASSPHGSHFAEDTKKQRLRGILKVSPRTPELPVPQGHLGGGEWEAQVPSRFAPRVIKNRKRLLYPGAAGFCGQGSVDYTRAQPDFVTHPESEFR